MMAVFELKKETLFDFLKETNIYYNQIKTGSEFIEHFKCSLNTLMVLREINIVLSKEITNMVLDKEITNPKMTTIFTIPSQMYQTIFETARFVNEEAYDKYLNMLYLDCYCILLDNLMLFSNKYLECKVLNYDNEIEYMLFNEMLHRLKLGEISSYKVIDYNVLGFTADFKEKNRIQDFDKLKQILSEIETVDELLERM